MKEAIATQILLGFLQGNYVVFIDGVSLKSEGDTWGGFLVSRYGLSHMVYGITSGVAIRFGEARASSELEDWRLEEAETCPELKN
jgi:hypothetical protein